MNRPASADGRFGPISRSAVVNPLPPLRAPAPSGAHPARPGSNISSKTRPTRGDLVLAIVDFPQIRCSTSIKPGQIQYTIIRPLIVCTCYRAPRKIARIADRLRVNVKESEGERSGIMRREFCGARQAGAIFRGALYSVRGNHAVLGRRAADHAIISTPPLGPSPPDHCLPRSRCQARQRPFTCFPILEWTLAVPEPRVEQSESLQTWSTNNVQ